MLAYLQSSCIYEKYFFNLVAFIHKWHLVQILNSWVTNYIVMKFLDIVPLLLVMSIIGKSSVCSVILSLPLFLSLLSPLSSLFKIRTLTNIGVGIFPIIFSQSFRALWICRLRSILTSEKIMFLICFCVFRNTYYLYTRSSFFLIAKIFSPYILICLFFPLHFTRAS